MRLFLTKERGVERWRLFLLPLFLYGCGAAYDGPPPSGPQSVRTDGDAALGPGDVFEVRVYQEEDLSGDYKVGLDGTINFPLIGLIRVGGLSPGRIAELIRNKLVEGQFIKKPDVSILLKESRSKKISVFGQVRQPGTFSYEENMTVVQAITLAGGFNAIADKNHTTLTRVIDGKTQRTRVPVEEIGEGEAADVYLKAGDIIFVPERVF